MKKLLLAGVAWLGLTIAAHAQTMSAIVVAACNTPPTTYVVGQSYPLTMDTSGRLCNNGSGGGGGGTTVTGNQSNASSAVAPTSTNIGSNSYIYGFNGTTWDQLQVDANKYLKVTAAELGIWQVTPTVPAASTLSLTSSTTAYTSGQLIASSATAGSVVNPSFAMPTLGGAIPRIRIYTNDTTSTAWASASVQIDLWDAAPTWTNGDHATWLPATGSSHHIASYSCAFPSAVWGDGLATECQINQGNYASIIATTVYWSLQATSGSGVLGASKTISIRPELN
jgi:hypothetical protein